MLFKAELLVYFNTIIKRNTVKPPSSGHALNSGQSVWSQLC